DRTAGNDCAGRENRTGGNKTIVADLAVVKYCRARADERACAVPRAVYERVMADGDLGRDLERDAELAVKDRGILNVDALAKPNRCDVVANDAVMPDVAARAEGHVADNHSGVSGVDRSDAVDR